MKILILTAILLSILAFGLINFYNKPNQKTDKKSSMQITSSAFQNNQKIPDKYTCTGANINPPLEFSDVPQDTKSLVLIVDDPDAPMGTWVHWVIYNIDPETRKIEENTKPKGIEAQTNSGKIGYSGPCPPSGTHRYFFKLYALNKTLLLMGEANKQKIEESMRGSIIAQAELIGLYSK